MEKRIFWTIYVEDDDLGKAMERFERGEKDRISLEIKKDGKWCEVAELSPDFGYLVDVIAKAIDDAAEEK